MFTNRLPRRQNGLTLIELVMFIVIVGVALAGILMVMNITIRHSADPMIRKQALAIAESLLEEIELQPFTYCDPDDPDAPTAKSTVDCKVQAQGLGPTPAMAYTDPDSGIQVNLPAETRYVEPRFDNVGDYNGFAMNGIRTFENTEIGTLNGYNAAVAVTTVGKTTFGFTDAENANALQIDVTVTAPGGEAITLTGYRFRYAPRAVP
jgi:MSHA pilin protein MshD